MPKMMFVNLPAPSARSDVMSAKRSVLIGLAAFLTTAAMIAGSGGALTA